MDKITNIDYPDSKEIEYGYDMQGNVIKRTVSQSSQSITTNYKRDALDRVCYKQYSDDPNWQDPNTFWPFDEILYDAAGNKSIIANIYDNNDSEFRYFNYDGIGNMILSGDTYPSFNYSIQYRYDSRGLLMTIEYPNDKIIAYTRDALGRIETVSYDGKTIAQYYYLGDKVTKKTIGDIEYQAVIDSLGRIDSESYGNLTFDYGFLNHTNRITSRNTIDYTFDTLGRVTGEESTNYTCDILGNPTNATEDNLIYAVDNEDRVIDVNDTSGDVAQYSYDSTGRRTSKTVDGTKTYFAYDKFGNIIAEYTQDGNDVNWQRDYIYGANGELVYMQLPVTIEATEDLEEFFSFCDAWLCYPDCDSNDLYWDDNNDLQINFRDWAAHMEEFKLAFDRNGRYILTDFMGSVVGVVHGGNVIEITYNAWGDPNYSGDIEGLSILWNGYYYDSETGNYYLRNRYYSPVERQFITEDPRGINPDGNWGNPYNPLWQYGDGFGLEVYASGDSVNGRDDWGLRKVCCKTNTTYKSDFYIPPGMGLPGGNYTTTKTTCSQNTIDIGNGKASAKAACQCHYKNMPNVEVYGAHENECCSCTIKMNHFGFYYPTSHRAVTIECTNGIKKTIELTSSLTTFKGRIEKHDEISGWLWPSGSITTSCEKVNDVLRNLQPVNYNLIGCGDSMNCIGFAHDLYNKLNQCP